MVDTGARFFVPSAHGEEIRIETQITGFGTSSFDVQHRVWKGETLAIEGREKRVLVKKGPGDKSITSCPVPDEVKDRFSV